MALIAFFTGVRVQLVEMERVFTQANATEFDEVVVMGEEKYLGAPGQCGQLRENRRGAVVVAGNQQIIQDKGHRLMFLKILIQRSQTKGQIELIPRAVTHSCNRNGRLIRAQTHQDGGIVGIELRAQPTEPTPGEALKDLARFFQQGALVFFPVPLERIGVADRYGESGEPNVLMEAFGLTAPFIKLAAIRAHRRKMKQKVAAIPEYLTAAAKRAEELKKKMWKI